MTDLTARHRISLTLGIIAMLWTAPVCALADDTAAKVKAAYLYNIAKFVEWPDGAAEGSIVIGVVGEHPFGNQLPRLASQKISGRRLVVRRLEYGADLAGCHIVFLGEGMAGSCRTAVEGLVDHPVLTVSEERNFASQGGVIELVQQGGKVRMRINQEAATVRRIKLSRQLLSVAELVTD